MRKRSALIPALLLLVTGCALAPAAIQATPTVMPTPAPASPPPTAALDPTPTFAPTPVGTERPRLSHSADIVDVVPNVTLDVELFCSDHWMRVQQLVAMRNTSPEPWDEVVFNVPINYVPEAFFLDRVTITVGETAQEGVPGLSGQETILRVPLPRPAQPGEPIQIEMGYRVVIPPVGPTDWPPIGTTGWTFALIQAGEWYPAVVPYAAGEGWHTWEYKPVGDPTVYPLANYTLNVTADEGITVVSGGSLGQDADGVWHFAVPAGRGIAFLASDAYESASGEANGIPITSYYLPEHAEAGQAALNIAAEAITLFEELYGTYPYDSLTIAENGFFGGMEYSSLISVTDYAYTTYPGQAPSILHVLVAHEAAHQWWYGAVGNDQANEPWLDEALAFYSEYLYFERAYPGFTNWWWEKRVDVYQPYGPVDATIYSYDISAQFITSVYGQAARFMRDLRGAMGDDAFFAFLRDYYARYSGQIVTGHDFKQMARDYSEADLSPVFEAYFANPEP